MAFIPTPQGVKVAVEGSQEAIPVVNVYHVDAGAAVSDTILDDVAAVFSNWMTTTLLPLLDSTYVLNRIVVTDISVANGHQSILTFTTGNVGGITGQPCAANAALCISWRTLQTGRSFRGRTYVGGLNNGVLVDPHTMGTTYANGFATAFVNLRTAIQTAGYVLSVLSLVANKIARVAGVLTEITSLIVDTKIDSQRRRTAN
jgi:hypothetical protein